MQPRGQALPGEITLVAVSKTVPAQLVAAAAAAGQRVFGENRVQEALGKAEACGPGLAWHLIGHLQRNKARVAARLFDVVESLDSPALALELDRRAGEEGRRLRVLVQVKLAEEATKSGVAQREAPALIETRGAPAEPRTCGPDDDSAAARDTPRTPAPGSRACAGCAICWDGTCCPRGTLRELSMGMSADYEVAIEEGATIVRVGSVIFGARAR